MKGTNGANIVCYGEIVTSVFIPSLKRSNSVNVVVVDTRPTLGADFFCPWASPLHMVKKSDGSWRPCGDYRSLNHITIPDRHPIPNLQSFHHKLEGAVIFSKIDLVKAYHFIPCLLYTSPSPRDKRQSRMPSSA